MLEYRPVWAEIDLDRIANNVRALAAYIHPAELMAVVKADGYGHGSVSIARVALASGARRLAVASPEEGRILRRAGIAAPILVLGALLPGQEDVFLEHRLTATLASGEAIEALSQAAERRKVSARVHIKVDTGMSRLGFHAHEVPFLVKRLLRVPGIDLEGIYTHLACADVPGQPGVNDQIRSFRTALIATREAGWQPEQVHVSNTAGVLENLGFGDCTMARVGIGIYGMYPSDTVSRSVHLEPALALKTNVATTKRVPAGTGVSYGHTYRTERETTLCTLPIGYAEGVSRRLSGRAHVLIGGQRYPLVGRVCMDQCIVDVGDASVSVGDEAVLIGRQGSDEITAYDWANILETIPYEVVCAISARVPRVYFRHGRREAPPV